MMVTMMMMMMMMIMRGTDGNGDDNDDNADGWWRNPALAMRCFDGGCYDDQYSIAGIDDAATVAAAAAVAADATKGKIIPKDAVNPLLLALHRLPLRLMENIDVHSLATTAP